MPRTSVSKKISLMKAGRSLESGLSNAFFFAGRFLGEPGNFAHDVHLDESFFNEMATLQNGEQFEDFAREAGRSAPQNQEPDPSDPES